MDCTGFRVKPLMLGGWDEHKMWLQIRLTSSSFVQIRLGIEFLSKRELYFHLCDPVLIDGGRMCFSLEKPTGRKCYTLSARKLVIIWGDTPHYWKWGRLNGSRIRVPYPFQWGPPSFDAGEAFAMMAASFITLWSLLGIGILLDGLFGTANGSTVSV